MKREWKGLLFVGLCLVMILLGGCAVFDALFGVNEKGEPTPGILQTVVGAALNGLFPGSGAALTGLGGLYAAWRARKWKQAMVATAGTIEEFGDLPKVELKEKLAASHVKAGVADMVQKICVTLEDDPEEKAAPSPPA